MDFTLKTYYQLLVALKAKGYTFHTFKGFLQNPTEKAVILRHDVDKKPGYALKMARLEHSMGICSTYYFRAVPASLDETVIKEIASLGHEIGYHYEDLSIMNGDKKKAIQHFEKQLEWLRKLSPVETICMHGSPRSRWDSRDMWKDYDYRKYDIIGEPYFDVDFNEVFYLTDTGRRWDGEKFSIRDKVDCGFNISFRSTHDIIRRIEELPLKVMINTHPQRWTDSPLPWLWELAWQRVKNVVKRVLAKNYTNSKNQNHTFATRIPAFYKKTKN